MSETPAHPQIKPLVSAIIIFLNEEKFFSEAIESVFTQTFENWELLLVDDGSTDASSEIARRYAAQNPGRLFYLEHDNHQNRGMSASRNLGLRHARGDYIAFLDADDVWLPGKLEQQINILDSQPEAAMVYGATQLWYGWTGKPEDIRRDCLQDIGVPPDTLIRPPVLLTLFIEETAITPCPSDVLVRREVVENVGGFEDDFPGMYEDQVFFAKVCHKEAVFVSGVSWDRHRQHPNSSCSIWRKTGEYYSAQANLAFLAWIRQYLIERGMVDTRIKTALQIRCWRYCPPISYRLLKQARYLWQLQHALLGQIARRTLPLSLRRWLTAQRSREVQ